MNATDWIDAYAEKLSIASPSEAEFEQILALAGVAAHASERVAAPVACWLAARAGVELDRAMTLAQELTGDG
jgi:hypothetical protein